MENFRVLGRPYSSFSKNDEVGALQNYVNVRSINFRVNNEGKLFFNITKNTHEKESNKNFNFH